MEVTVKRRRLPEAQAADAEDKDHQLLDFFGLPSHSHVEKSALAVVFKHLRVDLRSCLEAQAERSPKSKSLALLTTMQEVARYLVAYYNNPAGKLEHLRNHVENEGVNCIQQIKEWVAGPGDESFLDESFLDANSARSGAEIAQAFASYVGTLCETTDKETRWSIIQSQHHLRCLKVRVGNDSRLVGCRSGPYGYVHAQLGEVEIDPNSCLDLRRNAGIHLVATFAEETRTFKAMPGPCDVIPVGHIFLGCAICGNAEDLSEIGDCNCRDWLNSKGISETSFLTSHLPLDEVVVPSHLHNFCFGAKRIEGSHGILNLRKFTSDDMGEGGVQLVGLSKEFVP